MPIDMKKYRLARTISSYGNRSQAAKAAAELRKGDKLADGDKVVIERYANGYMLRVYEPK